MHIALFKRKKMVFVISINPVISFNKLYCIKLNTIHFIFQLMESQVKNLMIGVLNSIH